MTLLRSLAVAAVVVAAAFAPAGSRAQSFEISPVVVDLSAKAPSVVVTVKNTGATATRYQVKGLRWSEDRAGVSTLLPAEDLVIFPELFQLAPGTSRKVRVGASIPPEGIERSWRLMVEDLPDAVAPGAGRQVVVRTRFAIPVFLAPTRVEGGCTLALGLTDGKLELVVTNRGTKRAKPSRTAVEFFDEAGKPLAEVEVAPWYVLAMGERAWPVKVPDGKCAPVRKARVVAEVDGKPLEATQVFPGGVCGP